MIQARRTFGLGRGMAVALALALTASAAWGEDHDLVLRPAIDVTSVDATKWKSLDIKIGADFGNTSVPDVVRRGITNPVYSRFYINGIQDFTIPSGGVEIRLHWRNAALGQTPPAITDASWQSIGTLPVTYVPADGPFAITKTWPTDFPSVTTKSVVWGAPATGDYFHVRSEVVYLTGATDENPGDNVAVSLYESLSGLVDLVIVHDTSGSMGYYTYDGLSYMQHAISRAATFIPAINDSSRFAVVEFSTNFGPGYNDVWPSPAVLSPATIANKNNAIAAVGGLSAGGGTPMGAGLQRAIDLLVGAPSDGVVRKKVVLLLSDGYENAGTVRACDGSNSTQPCVGTGILSQLSTHNIRVFSLALGTAAWTQCLDCLATQSSGQWYATPNPSIDMTEVYLNIQDAYTSDDLYRVDRGTSGGRDDSYSTYFEGVDDVLYFILAWNDLEATLGLQLHPPDGAWSDPSTMNNATVFAGNGYSVVRMARARTGTWEYRVVGDDGKDYLAAVRSARTGVRLALQVDSDGIVGKPIDIHARLTRAGAPITNATLNATVQAPAVSSLETRLRGLARDYMVANKAIPLDPGDLKKNPDISARASFINTVTDARPHDLRRTRPTSVPLEHIGDGVYAGSLEEGTTVAGIYDVTVSYNAEGADRTHSRSVILRPAAVEPRRSRAEILRIDLPEGATQWLLRVYPADRFDNAVFDPALLQQVAVTIDGGQVDKAPEIVFDSAFQQVVIAEAGRTPTLESAAIGGEQIGIDGELPADDFLRRMLWLLLILIVLAILIWFWRRSKSA